MNYLTKNYLFGLRCLVASLILPSLFFQQAMADEVFNCTDARGRAVFSETPCPDTAVQGQALPQQVFRKLRALTKEGEKINAELKSDLESIKQCNHAIEAFKQKLAGLKSDVEKVALEHRYLFAAFDQLTECAQCRVSAITYCKKADSYLDKSMNELIVKRKSGG